MRQLLSLATIVSLLAVLGCPGPEPGPDAAIADAREREGGEGDGGEGDGGEGDGGVDAGSIDVAQPDAASPDVQLDAGSIEDAAARCPSYLDQLTLRVAKQTRQVGLIDEPVQSASSDNTTVVVAGVTEELALLRAQAAGSAQVSLAGATRSALVAVAVDLEDDHFVTAITEVQYGTGAGFGQSAMPGVVLGPPLGRGAGAGSLDVVSLGLGGSITLELGVDVVDGPGFDLIVFENPFFGFYESGEVAVSLDGVDFTAFPCTPVDPYPGCAGVNPVLAHVDNDIDPTDPAAAGGDAFDLGALGVTRARFVRITDVGGLDTGGGMAGFDLDAVVAIHALPRVSATLSGPATLVLTPGELAAPRFDVTAAARTLLGVPVRCEAAPEGVVELGCGCALRGRSAGQASLTARLGDLQTTVLLEVGP